MITLSGIINSLFTYLPTLAKQSGEGSGGGAPSSGETPGALITWDPTLVHEMNSPDGAHWQIADWSNNNPLFNCTFQPDNISFDGGIMSLTLDDAGCPQGCRGRPYASGEYRSDQNYGYGFYEVRMRPAAGSGLNSSFFTFAGPANTSNHHEIDFEFTGKDCGTVQLNYYVEGRGDHEEYVDLDFDACQEFHNYGFRWAQDSIIWYVDGREVHRVAEDPSTQEREIPSRPGKIMANFWPGASTENEWLGPFAYPGHPIQAEYDWIKYSPLEAGPIPPAAPASAAAPGHPGMPPGFTEASRTPEGFIDDRKNKISASVGRAAENQFFIEHPTSVGYVKYVAGNFSENIIQWMHHQAIGNPNANNYLERALNYRGSASPYWKTKAAFLVVSGNPTEDPNAFDQVDFLRSLGFITGSDHFDFPLSKEDRFTLLKIIYASYPAVPTGLQVYEGTDLLLRAEIELQLALLAPDEETSLRYLNPARQNLNRVIADNNHEIRKLITKRFSFLRSKDSAGDINNEFKYYQGQARALKAQLLIFETNEMMDPSAALLQLGQAYELLKAAVPNLKRESFHYQQIKQQAAECLTRMAFIIKDFEGVLSAGTGQIVAELRQWERHAFGDQSAEAYRTLLQAAKTFIEGVPGESVLDWENDYALEQERRISGGEISGWTMPLWLKQISDFAEIWRATLRMVEIGEDRGADEPPREYLDRQFKGLFEVQGWLEEILGDPGVLDKEVLASVKRTLAENLARQAFIRMDFGEDYVSLLNDAKTYLDQAIAEGRPVVAAEAHLWRAKILLVEAGKVETELEKDQLLKEAKDNILASFAQEDGEYLLKWSILSSAFQTYGDILLAGKDFVGAETRYRQALGEAGEDATLEQLFTSVPSIQKLFEKNYFARASLGDVLNWRSRYDEAIAQYRKVDEEAPSNHPTHLHAQLGMHEAASRKMENYQDMLADEELFKKIFAGQAPASPLIARAVDDLVEAWGTSESLYANIVWVGNKLLGLETPFDVPENSGDLFRTLEKSQAILSNHAKAALFLDVAETLMRMRKPNDPDRRFEDANRILPIEPGQTSIIPSNIRNLIENNLELKLSYHLLIAELKMKRERDVHLLINARIDGHDLIGAIFDSEDPDLVSRVIFDQLEGYSYHEEFSEMIRVARHYLEPENLEKVQKMYADLGRELHFPKFKFKLWKRLAEALTWDKQYPRALLELDAIYAEAQSLESTLPAFARLIQAQVHVTRGDIYRYEWSGQDFEESENNYLSAVELLTAIPRRVKEENVTLAQALFGLGEVYRYGKGVRDNAGSPRLGQKFRSHDESIDSYGAAEAFALTLPVESDERYSLLAQIYLGMAKLEEMYGNPNPAYTHIQNSANNLDLVYHPTTLLKNEIDHSFNEIATRVGLTVDPTFQMIHGQDGRTEFQITAGTQLPLIPLRLYCDSHLLRLNLELQLDMTPDTAILTPYFGGSYTGFFEHGSFSVGLETRFPFLNDWVRNIGTGNGTRFFLRPDLRAEMLLWTDYLTVGGRVAINDLANITDTDLDSWSASLNMNFAWTENRWAEGLRLALLEYNSYPYFWDGEFHRLHTLGFGLHYNVDIIKDLWNIHVDFLKLVNLGEGANQGFLPFEASVGTEFTIGRYFNFGVNYTRQQTVEYPLDMFGLWFRIVH